MLRVAVFAAALLTASVTQAAPVWRFLTVSTAAGATFALYADSASVVPSGSRARRMWVKYVLNKQTDGIDYINKLVDFDCSGSRYRFLTDSRFSIARGLIRTDISVGEWDFIDPESTGALELNAACVGFTPEERVIVDPLSDAKGEIFADMLRKLGPPARHP